MAFDIRGYTMDHVQSLLNKQDDASFKELEKLGALLTPKNAIEILERQKKASPRSLSSLFRGFSEDTVKGILADAGDNLLSLLYPCVHEEPLLHQLTIFGHAAEKTLTEIFQQTVRFRVELEALNLPTFSEIEPFFMQLSELESYITFLSSALQNALRLAWQSDRQQLVALLSPLKENAERLAQQTIGRKKDGLKNATGLYLKLEEQLSAIYDKLKDTDPSIEALAVLGIVYLEDFQAVGLANKTSAANTLQQVQHTLDQLGLHTVADVKANRIFSRQTLQDYIKHAFKLMRL